MCQSVVATATSSVPTVLPKAQEITDTFTDLFSLFASCHKIYDSSLLLSDSNIQELGMFTCHCVAFLLSHVSEVAIDSFLKFYREHFPSASVLPKMHMLEDHIIPWVKQWRVGCGLMGEQGAESLHATFNNSERSYNNMTNRVERLRVVLQNHHFKLLPCNTSLEPPLLKRRKKKGSSDDTS